MPNSRVWATTRIARSRGVRVASRPARTPKKLPAKATTGPISAAPSAASPTDFATAPLFEAAMAARGRGRRRGQRQRCQHAGRTPRPARCAPAHLDEGLDSSSSSLRPRDRRCLTLSSKAPALPPPPRSTAVRGSTAPAARDRSRADAPALHISDCSSALMAASTGAGSPPMPRRSHRGSRRRRSARGRRRAAHRCAVARDAAQPARSRAGSRSAPSWRQACRKCPAPGPRCGRSSRSRCRSDRRDQRLVARDDRAEVERSPARLRATSSSSAGD